MGGRVQEPVDGGGVQVGGDPRVALERVGERDALGAGRVVDDLVGGLPADGPAQLEHDLLGADHPAGQGEVGAHPGRVHVQPGHDHLQPG